LNALLITGTDTGVGKTVITTALAAYWQRYHPPHRLGIFKPAQCGSTPSDLDRQHYAHLFALQQSPEEINPVYFQSPLDLPIAAEQEATEIRLDWMWQRFEALTREREFVLVESLGGLGSPITHETTVADLAWDWRLPSVLVAPVQRGTIAHIVANVALARQARVHLKGILLNCVQPCDEQDIEHWASIPLIQSLTQKPVLGCIPHLADPTDLTKLVQIASHLDLERLLPLAL
jgi:dethiobiotin synthetase